MTNSTDPDKRRAMPWMRVLLFASLAANLLIVGMVAGAVLRGGPGGGDFGNRHPGLRDLGIGPFGQALSQSDRRDIGRAMASHEDDLKSNRQQIRKQVQAFLKALRTTPYDGEAVDALVRQQQGELFERQRIGQTILLEQIAAMGPQEREEFADRFEKILRRPRR